MKDTYPYFTFSAIYREIIMNYDNKKEGLAQAAVQIAGTSPCDYEIELPMQNRI